jgi:hypothetical protein
VIDISTEQLLTINDVPKHLPPSATSAKAVTPVTIWRWINNGIGGVKLDAIRIGRRWMTSREALGRFGAALAARSHSRSDKATSTSADNIPSTVANLTHDRAMAELAAQGLV